MTDETRTTYAEQWTRDGEEYWQVCDSRTDEVLASGYGETISDATFAALYAQRDIEASRQTAH